MSGSGLTRRDFVRALGSAGGAAWLAAGWPAVLAAAQQAGAARDAGAAFSVLSPDESADLAAIAERIFPGDDLPGAREAGVVYFMDSALAGFMAGQAGALRGGLKALNAKAAARQAGARFAQLPEPAQLALLKAEETSPFFGMVHFMTVAGMFALPSYGGNRDGAGWRLLGFDHRQAWTAPFGFYDAQATGPGKAS